MSATLDDLLKSTDIVGDLLRAILVDIEQRRSRIPTRFPWRDTIATEATAYDLVIPGSAIVNLDTIAQLAGPERATPINLERVISWEIRENAAAIHIMRQQSGAVPRIGVNINEGYSPPLDGNFLKLWHVRAQAAGATTAVLVVYRARDAIEGN